MPPRTHIAILGGGISGLSTAWYLAKNAPASVSISLIESANRTGGWLRSDRIPDPRHPQESILLERGPRSLRPQGVAGLNTLELVKGLQLESQLEPVLKSSPAAKNRYIYSRNKLHMLPNSIAGAFSHSLLAPKLARAGMDLVVKGSGKEDESIQDFVTRRFGKGLSDDLISAMVHGIYAGDVSKLSVRAALGMLYHLEKEYGSVVVGMLMGGGKVETPWDLTLKERISKQSPELKEFVNDTSIFSFRDGLEALSNALEQQLVKGGRVKLMKNSAVEKLDFDVPNRTVKISIADGDPVSASAVISTIPPLKLNKLLSKKYPELTFNPSVTVAVVNLVYSGAQDRLLVPGFGYLIPRSENSVENHGGLLGVVFDSCASPGQDSGAIQGQTLKLTAMMGGYMFDSVIANKNADPKELEAFFAKSATDSVRKHLKIDVAPDLVKVHINRECIPQYMVGHLERMQTLDQSFRKDYDGLLAVTGAGYLGVGVNDCIKNAREVAEAVVSKLEEEDDGEAKLVGQQDAVTGLERAWFI
ncbi:oxygen-dependent protoporphyrinogen oxidase [Podila humilis]|nr:oxygen-dependent protoporphyrinogen oxidase [Podila humilis]